MKKNILYIISFLVCSYLVQAQTTPIQTIGVSGGRVEAKGQLKMDSLAFMPKYNGFPSLSSNSDTVGAFFFNLLNRQAYIRDTLPAGGHQWSPFSSLFNNKNVAYVDSTGNDLTGQVSNPALPFRTPDTALARLKVLGSGVLMIGIGQFNSPADSAWTDNISVIGAQRPTYNWVLETASDGITTDVVTPPTALIKGTILHGQMHIVLHSGIKFYNIGVDNGPTWVAGGGTEGDCLAIGVAGTSGTVPFDLPTGIVIDNCSFLGASPTSAFHCLLLQRFYGAVVNNCSMVFGTHGFAIKGVNGLFSNIQCYANATEGIILKSDTYASCSGNILNGFTVSTFAGLTGGSGLILLCNSGVDLTGNICANGYINGMTTGVLVNTATANYVTNSQLLNITATNIGGVSFEIDSVINFRMNSCHSIAANSNGMHLAPSFKGPVFLTSCASDNSLGAGYFAESVPPLGQVIFTDCSASNNGNFGLGTGGTSQVYADLMTFINNVGGSIAGTVNSRITAPGSNNDVLVNNNGGIGAYTNFQANPASGFNINCTLGSFGFPLFVENSSTASQGGNIAAFVGNRSSTTNLNDNPTVIIQQATNASGNFASLDFGSAVGNVVTFLATRINDHAHNNADLYLGVNTDGIGLQPAVTVKHNGNVIIGLADTADNNNGVLQVNGTLTLTDPVSASTQDAFLLWNSTDLKVKQLPPGSVPLVVAAVDISGQTTGITITSFASAGGMYRVGGYITITAVSGDAIQLQVTWTDETNTVRTKSYFEQGSTVADLTTTGAFTFPTLDIKVKAGTTISAITVLTTGIGSITYDTGASIMQIK